MSKINSLSQDLINQIAAGEVVERPASVVKELVENSIDAGSTDITVEIENGGLNLIKVVDNGCGMDREDAEKSIEQHATSKLASVEDLYNINTLGFRGEALASISAVSDFRLASKDEESLAGTEVKVLSGSVDINDVGCATGTTVEVRDLFNNIPARRKYLKTTVTEFNHVVDLFINYSLAYPQLSWKLIHNGKPVYHFPEIRLEQRIADVLGEELSGGLLPIDIKINEIHITGFIGKPQVARNNRKLQYLFINDRPVSEYIVAKRVKDAYTTLIPRDLFPVYILNLNISSEVVDVNVHPRKLEVRFSNPQLIYSAVYNAVSRTLDEHDLVKTINFSKPSAFVPVKDVIETKHQVSIPIKNVSAPAQKSQIKVNNAFAPSSKSMELQVQKLQIQEDLPVVEDQEEEVFVEDYKILAQVQNSYIIVETEDGIKIYDQHASSERVQYEKLKSQWKIGQLSSQKMLLPQNIELTPGEGRLINENQELFTRLGFDISSFGGNSFVLSSVPQWLVDKDLKQVVLEIIGSIEETMILDDHISEPIDRILKMMSCKSAIKFGDSLSDDGMRALINDLEKLGNQYTCVHGRPCVMEFSFIELEKMFKRRT